MHDNKDGEDLQGRQQECFLSVH